MVPKPFVAGGGIATAPIARCLEPSLMGKDKDEDKDNNDEEEACLSGVKTRGRN